MKGGIELNNYNLSMTLLIARFTNAKQTAALVILIALLALNQSTFARLLDVVYPHAGFINVLILAGVQTVNAVYAI